MQILMIGGGGGRRQFVDPGVARVDIDRCLPRKVYQILVVAGPKRNYAIEYEE